MNQVKSVNNKSGALTSELTPAVKAIFDTVGIESPNELTILGADTSAMEILGYELRSAINKFAYAERDYLTAMKNVIRTADYEIINVGAGLQRTAGWVKAYTETAEKACVEMDDAMRSIKILDYLRKQLIAEGGK